MLKSMIGGLMVATLVTPVLADEYWVQYDYSTHECSIVQSDTHEAATRFPWSAPTDGSRPKDLPNPPAGGATGGLTAGATNEKAGPNSSNNSEVTDGSSTSNASNTASATQKETGTSSASNNTSGAGPTNNTNDESESPVVAAWKRKAELAQNNHVDVSKALVGRALETREQAEEEMQIMRICGLKN